MSENQEDAFVDETGLTQVNDFEDFSPDAIADIPVAVRESPTPAPRSKPSRRLWWIAGGLGAIGLLTGVMALVSLQGFSKALQTEQPLEPIAKPIMGQAIATVTGQGTATEAATLLNHFPYSEAPEAELETTNVNGSPVTLRRAAAEKFTAMVDAAKAAGIDLVPLSGFRSVAEQEHVFFDLKAERGQAVKTRAEVSAPPGYSEHHTGYAVDIGDADHPDRDLQFDFEETAAFKWLKDNAAFYSFELSFPKNNPQGVSYEPWHWRFVGDRTSLETFYRARTANLQTSASGGKSGE